MRDPDGSGGTVEERKTVSVFRYMQKHAMKAQDEVFGGRM